MIEFVAALVTGIVAFVFYLLGYRLFMIPNWQEKNLDRGNNIALAFLMLGGFFFLSLTIALLAHGIGLTPEL